MFTGLIQRKGHVEEVVASPSGARIVIAVPAYDEPWQAGESIAVDGVCLTLVAAQGEQLSFDVLNETLQLTHLGSKAPGDAMNIERALRLQDRLGGHLVAGHVDGVGDDDG